MKRLIRKSEKVYKTKEELEQENNENSQEVSEQMQEQIETPDNSIENEELEPFTDITREDPYLGRYVEITNKRSKYYGYHARVDDKLFTNRYKIFIEPQRSDDDGGKGYIVNFVGVEVAPKWFTVVE